MTHAGSGSFMAFSNNNAKLFGMVSVHNKLLWARNRYRGMTAIF